MSREVKRLISRFYSINKAMSNLKNWSQSWAQVDLVRLLCSIVSVNASNSLVALSKKGRLRSMDENLIATILAK